MSGGAKLKNLDAFKKRMEKRLKKNPALNIKTAMVRSTNVVRDTVVTSIASGGAGRTYEKYNPRRTHTASAKGQPPATDTGVLVSGISTSVGVESNAVVGKIMAYAPTNQGDNYALFLEFGTKDMDARPFMQPALDRNAKKIRQIFVEEGVIE
jgi:HK97 gp10 family phage protein